VHSTGRSLFSARWFLVLQGLQCAALGQHWRWASAGCFSLRFWHCALHCTFPSESLLLVSLEAGRGGEREGGGGSRPQARTRLARAIDAVRRRFISPPKAERERGATGARLPIHLYYLRQWLQGSLALGDWRPAWPGTAPGLARSTQQRVAHRAGTMHHAAPPPAAGPANTTHSSSTAAAAVQSRAVRSEAAGRQAQPQWLPGCYGRVRPIQGLAWGTAS
jgi:hypothetical protein